ncbi:helix-hairpin-helix domain-containing protein [Methanimicrococcus blatticola]|uniref:DNA-binding protein MutS2 n=1 Tax=Methanimicrococcus blatticola TaxID=91560 RepID=A0A484F4X2_9EURY|nr:helix-hairpin-helix domain-containing protein [Methanimicrococcus blatticola]MBZ3935372.1 endonuclease MutS2 [Methanimicrococcus blatticola]MCC2508530.1 endonuclease MutS2 [Methanimicrococcus blatticola]TDQ67837.1 DNA mismatch repair MutS family protein [Methanimicrococcus blatticola]
MISDGESTAIKTNMRLRDISGIGSILEKRLVTCFGSEEKALETLLKGDVHELCRVEGMTRKSAQSLILNVSKEQNGVSLEDFLKTKEAEALYAGILKIIKKHCCTEFSADFIERLVPYPKRRLDLALDVREKIETHLTILQSFSPDEREMIQSLLSQITPTKDGTVQKIRDRAVLAFSEVVYIEAHEKFGSILPVHLVTDPQECADFFFSYRSVILFDFPEFDLPESGYEYFRDIDAVEIEQLIPEMALSYFVKNLKSFDASLRLAEILAAGSMSGLFSQFTAEESLELRTLLKRLNADGSMNPGIDPEADRLRNISVMCDEILLRKAAELSDKLKNVLTGNTLTLDGDQLMHILSGADLKQIVTANVSKPYRELLKETLTEITETLSLKRDEEMILSDIYGDEIECPVKLNLESLTRFKKEISGKSAELEQKQKKQLSKELAGRKEAMSLLINDCLEFDCWYSAASFANAYQMTFPVFAKTSQNTELNLNLPANPENQSGNVFFNLEGGRNLFLSSKYGFDAITPVSYDVENTVLLSGVNSGGKTTVLELVGQCLILAHMGFPVPAELFEFSPIEEFYYFGKSKGTLDAGAFETTLRNFSIVSESNGTERAVFADELESITEPGASAKIIAGLLETFCENGKTLSLFVSHLAESIMENCDIPIRVDGIEAGGLDDDLNLIVNRNPIKNHIAKSTPELIVEKLFLTSTGVENAFYEKLKKKFEAKN